MKTEKTNMDYLYEFIKDNDEAKEFWEAVSEELSDNADEIKELKEEVDDMENKIESLEKEVSDYEKKEEDLEVIDLGFGTIEFRQPDNMKLQIIMEHLQENHEKLLQFE